MSNRIPQTLTGCNVFVEGIGFLGTSAKVKLPTVEREQFEIKHTALQYNINAPIFKPLEAEFTFAEVDPRFFAMAAKLDDSAQWHVKYNLSQGQTQIPLVATFQGSASTVELPESELKEVEVTAKMNVRFYKLELSSKELYLIDTKNMIARIHGHDLLEAVRGNIL